MSQGYKVDCIIKRPDEAYGHKASISTSLRNLQNTVEGYIETVTIAEDLVIICNEEGRLLGLPYNCNIAGVDFVGTIIVIGADGEEFCDVPISFKDYKRLFFGAGK